MAGNRRERRPDRRPSDPGVAARRLAIEALLRIDTEGAYANLALPPMLDRSNLEPRDRGLVTELVYGTTRMRRALDFIVDRFLLDEIDPQVRAALRLGAYQLHEMDTPAHAAVGATVGAVRGPGRGLVNAVLRKIAAERAGLVERPESIPWPSDAVRLSYPDWIADELTRELGPTGALAAMEAMNLPASVHRRDDGYIQDPASGFVAAAVDARPGDRVLDLCAAPGGKATLLARSGAHVVAGDLRRSRTRLIARNVARLLPVATGPESPAPGSLAIVTADATAPPFAPGSFDRVLVDAPCSGLGSLRRRPDARWRIDSDAPARLAELQGRIVAAAIDLLVPGGELTYSVCTLTGVETRGVLASALASGEVDVLPPPSDPWEVNGDLAWLLPAADDGMVLFRLRRKR